MTYFPFVSFFSDVLIQLIDEIKIRRMEDYAKNERNMQIVDVRYFAGQLGQLVGALEKQMCDF